MSTDITADLTADGILPVIVVDDPGRTADLADALVAGGLRFAEITFRTAGAVEALDAMARHRDLVVGAGTVVSTDQVDVALAHGARFIVSPGFDRRVVEHCQERGVSVFPGTATATDIQRALRCGLTTVKFFPAEPLGGRPLIAALAGPFPDVRFIPTGGIDASNAAGYLQHPSVLAVGGSWMVPRALVAAADWGTIAARVAEARVLAATCR